MKIKFGGATVTGGRRRNEDSFYIPGHSLTGEAEYSFGGEAGDENILCFAVCDGLGGEYAGDLASQTAVGAIGALWELGEADDPRDFLIDAVSFASDGVHALFDELSRRVGRTCYGGCTFTGLAVHDGSWCFLNLGDSPAYLCRDGQVREISHLHNVAQCKRDMGIEPDESDEHRLLRFVGMRSFNAEEDCHTEVGELRPGDVFILVSDGVMDGFTPEGLRLFCADDKELSQLARELVGTATQSAGARCGWPYVDNCTAVIVKVCE